MTLPLGGSVHLAGPGPDGGWRVIEVWASEEEARRFLRDELAPALGAAGARADLGAVGIPGDPVALSAQPFCGWSRHTPPVEGVSPSPPAGHSLIGRRLALATLDLAIDDALQRHGSLVLLTGDPGIGKSALARAAAEQAAARGARIARGTCWDGDGAPAFWPWAQVLRGLEADDLLAVATSGDESAARFRMFDAVAHRLGRSAEEQPLVVVLDDLHWADASSVRLLAFLAHQLRTAPVLLLGAYRDTDVMAPDHPLHDVLRTVAEQARVLPLSGLDVGDVARLVRRTARTEVSPDVAVSVHERTGGNPFFVEQLSQLIDAGTPSHLPELPPVIRDVVAHRLDRLPASTRDLLDAGAVLGTEFDVSQASAVTGVGHDHLDDAVRERVVHLPAPATARFAHDLFREVLYSRLPTQQRARLHLAVAERLEAQRAAGRLVPPQEPAHHRAAALPLGDRTRAVVVLLEAARDATRRGAFEEAADQYRRTAEASEGELAPALVVEYGHALRRAGRPDGAYRRFLAAADHARRAGDSDVLAAAALGAHRVATTTDVVHTEVVALLEEALARVTGHDRCRVLAALARGLTDGPARDEPRADALVREAVREARAFGDAGVLAHALWAQLDVGWRPGTARDRLELAAELAAVAEEAGERELVLEARFAPVIALLELADPAWSTALDEFARGADESQLPHYRYLALSRRASRAALAGPVDAADALIDEAATYGEHVGEPDAWGVKTSQWVGLAMLRGGWSRIIDEATGRVLVPPEFLPFARGMLHLERGERAPAAALVAGLPDGANVAYRWRRTVWRTSLAPVAAAVGDRGLCARLYDRLLPEAGTIGVLGGAVFTTGPVDLQLGLLAGALGRSDDAVAHLEAAVAIADRIAAGLYAARARRELAAALLARGGEGDRERARDLLAAVAEEAIRLGLPDLAAEARSEHPTENAFRRDGDVWTLTFAGCTARLRDAKGLADLARLLADPGKDVPAINLLGLEEQLGADPVLDDQARRDYKRRVAELDAQLTEADVRGDAARGAILTAERDAVVRELVRASGLGGRRRRLGDAAERARSTVTARIRDTLRHVDAVHPELAAHLRASVTTGTRCSYRPAEPVRWRV